MKTIEYANEIGWSIGCNSPKDCHVCKGNGNYGNNKEYVQECCIPQNSFEDLVGINEEFVATCLDTYGDGWHGAYLEIDGNRYCDQFTDGSVHSAKFKTKFTTIPDQGLLKNCK